MECSLFFREKISKYVFAVDDRQSGDAVYGPA